MDKEIQMLKDWLPNCVDKPKLNKNSPKTNQTPQDLNTTLQFFRVHLEQKNKLRLTGPKRGPIQLVAHHINSFLSWPLEAKRAFGRWGEMVRGQFIRRSHLHAAV
jgi:hypothetical protein